MASRFYHPDAIFDDPIQQLVREAHRIVTCHPHQGQLDEKHMVALRSIELGIVSRPRGVYFDEEFLDKLPDALPG
ncbi:hypothetical protein ABT56_18265 [Photobacterium aquae]|uniref:Uncharacterized protein n=1 Tax=Photobacterium aquae TaxID=1195763 RepID=A0A0J1JN30_9GAMM|nr:hypothetical protein [Photobacterium aquae]KLV03647.1 hypothetical protein ABT56_18265 [Photobacterium aquae]